MVTHTQPRKTTNEYHEFKGKKYQMTIESFEDRQRILVLDIKETKAETYVQIDTKNKRIIGYCGSYYPFLKEYMNKLLD